MTQLEIEAFLTTVKLGSISAAANLLFITQPALSRRIHALENELGYPILVRGKGIRSSVLTEDGKSFIPIAKKYNVLWREAKAIASGNGGSIKISSVGSVSTYLLPEVFSLFMTVCPECNLQFNNYHSLEAYDYVARGEIDLAFISDDMFSREVYTVPLFREPMVLAFSNGEKYAACKSPRHLDGADEIRLPWNPEYDLWHDHWFSPMQRPRVQLDQMSLLEYFLRQKDLWAILPNHVANAVRQVPGVRISMISDGPPDSIIYYLTREQQLNFKAEQFLDIFKEHLKKSSNIIIQN